MESKSSNIYFILFIFVIIVYATAVAGYALWANHDAETKIIQEIDRRLLVAARSLKYMLAEDFHDRAVDEDSISSDEETRNRIALSGFAAETEFKYVYTLVQKEGRYYFSAPTVTEEELLERESWYFYPYDDIPKDFVKAYEKRIPVFTSYSDQWGTFRSVALPELSPGGRLYLACADYDISYMENLLKENYITSTLTAVFFLALTLPFMLLYRKISGAYNAELKTINNELTAHKLHLEELVEERTRELGESEAAYRTLVSNIPGVICRCGSDPRWTMHFISDAIKEITGYPPSDFIQNRIRSYADIIHPHDREMVWQVVQEHLRQKEAFVLEYRIIDAWQNVRWVSEKGQGISDEYGKIRYLDCALFDITDRKKAEAEHLAHHSFLESMERIEAAIRQTTDLNRMMANVLEAVQTLFGADRAWLLYPCDPSASSWQVPMERTRPEYPGAHALKTDIPMTDGLREMMRTAMASDDPVRYDPESGLPLPPEIKERFSIKSQITLAVHPKIGEPWMFGMHQCSFMRVWTKSEEQLFKEISRRLADALSSLLFFRDLRESESRYRALYEESKKAEEVYRSLLRSSADAIVLCDMKGLASYLSPAFAQLFGWTSDELTGKPVPFMSESDGDVCSPLIRALMSEGMPFRGVETRRCTKDGRRLDVSISGSRFSDHEGNPAGMLFVIRDITENKRLETRFQQAQKMEAIGTLASGIAHDFNNLLMGIRGRTSLMLSESSLSRSDVRHLVSIGEYVKSAADLTRQLLGLARGGKYEVRPANINELVKKSVGMFGRTRKEINIHTKFQEDIRSAEVDGSQISQVLLNLFVNAWQAMPGGGDLFIETENVVLDENYIKMFSVRPGNYVKICITDTGIGMDEAIHQRIFDPFFTTKERGRGTGLGLASAYGIIKNHNGLIHVYSEKGEGSTFTVYLPASEKVPVTEPEVSEGLLKGTETVLLVDDETLIIDVGGQMLEKMGYEVFTAQAGEEALRICQQNKDRITLAIIDIIMPDMGGSEVYSELKKISPRLKTLISSGYSINEKAAGILAQGADGFIQKPFSMEQLSRKLREILDGE